MVGGTRLHSVSEPFDTINPICVTVLCIIIVSSSNNGTSFPSTMLLTDQWSAHLVIDKLDGVF
jgi:hypothetical protein